MKISYRWLKRFLPEIDAPEVVAEMLTNLGLEVEGTERVDAVEGGLEGLVVGHVLSVARVPDSDKLSLTMVDVGTGEPLQIVCGAPNVAAGQKVPVATVGAKLYPTSGEPFVIKKGKIRGTESHGMICAEDEIGLGTSHDGIMVLDETAKIGQPLAAYLQLESDYVMEVGLTPNRADAMSHMGVARDLRAAYALQGKEMALVLPEVDSFAVQNESRVIPVEIRNPELCPRYSSLTVSGVQVGPSPEWLRNQLKALGLKSINNIVDITNWIQHGIGQPLHAFDADQISGGKVVVKTLEDATPFTALDGSEKKMNAADLMICNTAEGMCIAGVFGGIKSGVSDKTKNVFIESAYFHPVGIRKTARRHGLFTDASFRYERGTDPNITLYALKLAAVMMRDIAGGSISSSISDLYPTPIAPFEVSLRLTRLNEMIGKEIPKAQVLQILKNLDIHMAQDRNDTLSLQVPPYRVDVTREIDVIEEVLRVYGYNNVEIPEKLHTAIVTSRRPEPTELENEISQVLNGLGFHEMMANSLTAQGNAAAFGIAEEKAVRILNPLSQELSEMRVSLLFGGLQSVAHNQNRKRHDLKLFEFGNTYFKSENGYHEQRDLMLISTGYTAEEHWSKQAVAGDLFWLKGVVENVLSRLKLGHAQSKSSESASMPEELQYTVGKKVLARVGYVGPGLMKRFDVKGKVAAAVLHWDAILQAMPAKNPTFKALPQFPAVRRDLALLVDKQMSFDELKRIALDTERKWLQKVELFDVYEGKNLPADKKSYALAFTLYDEERTLTDEKVEMAMGKLLKAFTDKAGAVLR